MALITGCLLLIACGSGTRVEIANDIGFDFLVLSLTISGEELNWTDISRDDTVSGSLTIQDTGTAPVAKICWDNGFETYEGEIVLIDSAFNASKIQILISTDATSLTYSF
jgi:hypothetical protein